MYSFYNNSFDYELLKISLICFKYISFVINMSLDIIIKKLGISWWNLTVSFGFYERDEQQTR